MKVVSIPMGHRTPAHLMGMMRSRQEMMQWLDEDALMRWQGTKVPTRRVKCKNWKYSPRLTSLNYKNEKESKDLIFFKGLKTGPAQQEDGSWYICLFSVVYIGSFFFFF